MLSKLVKKIVACLLLIYFSIVKFITRKLTGLCELQRICYATDQGAKRCLQIEQSIQNSKSPVLRKINQRLAQLSAEQGKFNCENKYESVQTVEYAVEGICKAKSINSKIHEDFVDAMRMSLLQIYGYKQLCFDVNRLKSTPYDSNDTRHEAHLMQIWDSLNPDDPLDARISNRWTSIGFQGNDPKTDFRGMGTLGLLNLHYFATRHPSVAQSILLHSNHPANGYPFAITGINLTHMAYVLLNNGKLKTHFFNAINGTMNLDDFHKIYCFLFVHFDRLWLRMRPKDVMEFSHVKQKFLEQLDGQLAEEQCKLIWEPALDVV